MEPSHRRSSRVFVLVFFWLVLGHELPAQTHRWSTADLWETDYGTFEQGRRPDHLVSLPYGRLLIGDVQYVFTSPLRWSRYNWLTVGGVVGTVALASTLDSSVQTSVQLARTPARDAFTEYAQRFGEEYSWMVLGGFELVGVLTKDHRAKAVAMDGLSASVISAGLITPSLKKLIGRSRPNSARGPFEFTAFSDQYSFPSGHTTQAFAVATVIAAHYDQYWVKTLSYGVAASVGYARIHQNRHYLSDVLAGAIIGHVVGKTIVRRHGRFNDDEAAAWTPVVSPEMTGLVWSKSF